ncbi:MAG: AraC family transcriptional regulator [Tissierellia bacterium]|nr:AraC family transcriptional regulator [Tissierellia bacterium]
MKEWYKNSRLIDESDYRIEVEYNCEGSGRAIWYNIFPGLTLFFLFFNTEDKFVSGNYDSDIICISYCYRGRYECEFENHQNSQLQMGYMSVYGTEYLPSSSYFPLKEYEGLSIVIEENEISEDLKSIFNIFGINLEKIKEIIKYNKIWYVSKVNDELEDIFTELYKANDMAELGYIRVKIIELLNQINYMIENHNRKLNYHKQSEIQEVKRIWEEMKSNLESKLSVEKLVKKSNLPIKKFYIIFNQIYGNSPYFYLKKYKMNIAANQLLNTEKRIIDIALELGYTKPGKFTEAFKSVYEETPSEYRIKRKGRNGAYDN